MKKNYTPKIASIILLLSFAITINLFAQKKTLKYSDLFTAGQTLLNPIPSLGGWFDDQNYLLNKTDSTGAQTLVAVNAETGEEEEIINYSVWKEELPKGINLRQSASRTKDRMNYIFKKDNDLYFLSLEDQELKRLTETEAKENNPKISPDGKSVAYTSGKNLYVTNIRSGKTTQLTNDGGENIYNGWASWVYMEEILGRSTRYAAFWWSPDGKNIAFLRFDDSPVPKFPLFNADGVHGELEWEHYPEPGDPNPIVKLGVAHIDDGTITWLDFDYTKDQYIAWPFWTPDGKQLFFEWMNRDQNLIKIYSMNPFTGASKVIYKESATTWVNWLEDLEFLSDNSGFILRSNRSGWQNLYMYSMNGKLKTQLTENEWDATSIKLIDEENERIFFEGTGENSTEQHLFVVDFNGFEQKQLTETAGTHKTTVSPNGGYFYDNFSSFSTPPILSLYRTDGTIVKDLGNGASKTMEEYAMPKVEMFTIPTDDGFDLPAKWFLPPNFDAQKKYPILFSIYGGPNAKTVRNSYSRWFFNDYLAMNGIIVIQVDHRGSGHFGKEGTDLMYRNLGKWEMEDFITAAKWARNLPYVNKDKIAITGGSYGGYVTAMALTYGADYFNYGIAQYSVTDWRLYDNVYTERYMDEPKDNKDGYDFGSVMTHADNYKGKLLITHGTMDDNVHMQNTLQLIDKLEDLDKDFELMIYPNARHGIGYPKIFHSIRNSVKFWFNNLLDREFDPEKD
ncbi:MAG: S9 family peptidase [Chlorobi bacterium]|nr:S9 family peptidase [Chlorobiota bacterium]